jgi:hypothetical protein
VGEKGADVLHAVFAEEDVVGFLVGLAVAGGAADVGDYEREAEDVDEVAVERSA